MKSTLMNHGIAREFLESNQRCCARHEGQKLGENNGSGARQAMADVTLAPSCPSKSMALVLTIMRLVAAASPEAARPRWREWYLNRDRAAPRCM